MSRTVLITGAAGFVGRALCPLLFSHGYDVRCVTRRPAAETGWVQIGEIGADTDWHAALEGVSCVVHLAARVHVMKDSAADPLAEFRRVNVAGTEHLAREAARLGARRFVYVSSIKVNGEGSPHPLPLSHRERGECFYRETDSPHPHDPYAISKWEAEQALNKISSETGMEVVILRPPLVYGPGVRGNFLRLMNLVDRGVPLPFGAVNNQRDLIYVGNLADAIVTCIEHPQAAGQTFLLCDGDSLSTPDLIRRLAHAMGKSPRLFSVPPFLFDGVARFAGKAALQRLTGSLRIDSSHIRNELGWRPPFSVEQGIEEAVRGYLRH